MNNEPLISVVIPVYNVEKYLNQCVDSVLNQTYTNLEIILVDDGSKDGSPEICDSYKEKDERVKVIHKKNGGLSSARNKGIENCFGDYVLFLDSDDFWDDTQAIAKLVDRINITHPDVLNYTYKKFNEDDMVFSVGNESYLPMPTELKTKKEQLQFLSVNNLYIASACNKLVKVSLLNQDLLFEQGAYSEDIEWCALLLKKAQTFDYINMNFYCYRQRAGSIAHSINDKSCSDLYKHISECIKLCNSSSDDEKDALLKYTAYQFSTFFIIQALAKNQQKPLIKKMKNYSFILKHHGNNKKVRILHYGCKILGYTLLCKIVRFAYRIKH